MFYVVSIQALTALIIVCRLAWLAPGCDQRANMNVRLRRILLKKLRFRLIAKFCLPTEPCRASSARKGSRDALGISPWRPVEPPPSWHLVALLPCKIKSGRIERALAAEFFNSIGEKQKAQCSRIGKGQWWFVAARRFPHEAGFCLPCGRARAPLSLSPAAPPLPRCARGERYAK